MMISDTEVQAALKYLEPIQALRRSVTLPEETLLKDAFPYVILGLGSRESAWGTSAALDIRGPGGRGDHGHGHGLMQIDDRWHGEYLSTGAWSDAASNIAYGVNVLLQSARYLEKKGVRDGSSDLLLTRGALAGYNAGPYGAYRRIMAQEDPDLATTGRNFGRNVIERALWYAAHLGELPSVIPLAEMKPRHPQQTSNGPAIPRRI